MALGKQQGSLYTSLFLCLCVLIARHPSIQTPSSSIHVPGTTPSPCEIGLLSHMDRSAVGYLYSLRLMHAGDLHGQQIPLDAYDYTQVVSWLRLINTLIPQSDIAPFLATFYFSSTQHHHAIYQLIHFLKSYAEQDLSTRWRWYTYGIYLARHSLKDLSYAYYLATNLTQQNRGTLPLWVKQMPGSLLIKMNEKEQAKTFFHDLLTSSIKLSPEERHFLQYRLETLTEHQN